VVSMAWSSFKGLPITIEGQAWILSIS